MNRNYQQMWENFGQIKSDRYLDYKFNPTHRIGLTNYLREELIYQFLDPKETDIVLDAGCAAGRQLFKIADQIKAGYGADIAQSFIERANQYLEKQNILNLCFQQSPIEQLPFIDNYFDKVITAEVLEHVVDKDVALKELLRVLRKDGLLIVTIPNLNANATFWGRFLRLIGLRKFQPLVNFCQQELAKHGDAHVREFSRQQLQNWLKSSGLEILAIKSVSFIDGPGFDFLLKFPLHFKLTQQLIIKFEKYLTKKNLFFGRHLIIKAQKK